MSRPHAAAAGGGDRSSHHGHQVRQRGGGAPHPELGAAAAHQAGHQPAAQADQVLGVGGFRRSIAGDLVDPCHRITRGPLTI